MAEENTVGTQEQNGTGTENQEKTFTQTELDTIVENRLSRERKKYEDYDSLKEKAGKYDQIQEAGKTELQKANERADSLQKQLDDMTKKDTVRQAREKVSKETNVPENLLTGEDEKTCKEQAEAILKFAKPNSYPGTKPNNTKLNNNAGTQENESLRGLARSLFGKGE